jgi:hypothetical protein
MIVGAIIVVAGATTGYVLLRRRALNRLYGSSAHHQGVVFDAASVPKAPSQPVNNLETTVVKPTDKPDEPSPGPGPTNPA